MLGVEGGINQILRPTMAIKTVDIKKVVFNLFRFTQFHPFKIWDIETLIAIQSIALFLLTHFSSVCF